MADDGEPERRGGVGATVALEAAAGSLAMLTNGSDAGDRITLAPTY